MKIKTLKAICIKRYGRFRKANGLMYVEMKIAEYELKISKLKLLKHTLKNME